MLLKYLHPSAGSYEVQHFKLHILLKKYACGSVMILNPSVGFSGQMKPVINWKILC